MRKISFFIVLLFIAGCGIFSHSRQEIPEDALANYFFTPMAIQDTHAYQIYKNQYKDEMAKICYLINLVRYSPLTFSRLGQKVKGHNAGRWLDYKLDRYYHEIITVEDFIENIGDHSLKTGKPYYVIYEDTKVPMKVVYYNELRRLYAFEEKCEKDKKKDKDVQDKIDENLKVEKADNDNPDSVPSVSIPKK